MNPSFVLFEATEFMPVFNDAEVPVLDSDPDSLIDIEKSVFLEEVPSTVDAPELVSHM